MPIDSGTGIVNARSANSIVKLAEAGLDENTIIAMVNTQPSKYSLAVDDVLALKRVGVSDKIIAAMVHASSNRVGAVSACGSSKLHLAQKN